MRGPWASLCRAGLVLAALGVVVPSVTRAQPPCFGDCDGDGEVRINEIIVAINIAMGITDESACGGLLCEHPPVDIDCLVVLVGNALEGCPQAPALTAGIVFGGEGNRLRAYDPGRPGFPEQVVIPSNADAPGEGRDINGQICFTRGPRGERWMIAGEDTNQQAGHEVAGWGVFELTGAQVGDFGYRQIGKVIPTYQRGADDAENYGCGFLSDGRLLLTDVGSQAAGPADGQLVMWFPPLDTGTEVTPMGILPVTPARYCKLDVGLGTAQQIAIDAQDRIYVSSARGASLDQPAGVYRYTGPFPTSDRPEDGCDGLDDTGAPMATHVQRELFIRVDGVIVTPSGVVIKPDGGFYVASVLNGVIAEYDADGQFVRRILSPARPGLPIPTGTPLGLGLASDGTLYFADIGLVAGPRGIGPGNRTGTVRRIRFVDGRPQEPEIMQSGLAFPDGIGILENDTP